MLGRSNTHSHTPFLCLESIPHLLNKSDDGDPLQFVTRQDPRGGRGFHMPVTRSSEGTVSQFRFQNQGLSKVSASVNKLAYESNNPRSQSKTEHMNHVIDMSMPAFRNGIPWGGKYPFLASTDSLPLFM